MDKRFETMLAKEDFTWQDIVIFLADGHLEKEIDIMCDEDSLLDGLEDDNDRYAFHQYITQKLLTAIGR